MAGESTPVWAGVVLLLLCLTISQTGCLSLAASGAEHILVDRIGQPLPGAEETPAANPNREDDFPKSPTDKASPDPESNNQRVLLLNEMLERTDDPVFQRQLMLLRSQADDPALNSELQVPAMDTQDDVMNHRSFRDSYPAANQTSAEGQIRPADSGPAPNPGAIDSSHPADLPRSMSGQNRVSSGLSSIAPSTNDLRPARDPLAARPSDVFAAPDRNTDRAPTVAGQSSMTSPAPETGQNQVSFPVRVTGGETKSENRSAQVEQEIAELRAELKETQAMHRQMMQTTSAALSNRLLGGANPSSVGTSLIPTSLPLGGFQGEGTDSLSSSNNPLLSAMLQDQMQQQISAQLTNFEKSVDPNSSADLNLANNDPAMSPSGQENLEPPAPGEWKEDLSQAVASLQRSIPQATGTNERQTLEVYLRLLKLIANNHDDAVRTIESLPPELQTFWRQQIFALSQIMRRPEDVQDAMFVDNSRRASKTLSHLREAMTSLESMASLQLRNLTFCEAIRSFGDYDIANSTTIDPGAPLLVYCEVENYSTRKMTNSSGQRHVAQLKPSYAIYNEQRQVVYQQDYPTVEDQCKSLRQDFYLIVQLDVPATLPRGNYQLVITVEDLQGSKVTTGTPLPFYVR